VGVLVALDEVLDALEVTVEEPDGRTEELEVCFEVPEATDTEAEVVEDEPEFSAAATVASVDFECTLITFFAMRAPTTAPTIARIARTPATQNQIGLIFLFFPGSPPSSADPTAAVACSLSVLAEGLNIPSISRGLIPSRSWCHY